MTGAHRWRSERQAAPDRFRAPDRSIGPSDRSIGASDRSIGPVVVAGLS